MCLIPKSDLCLKIIDIKDGQAVADDDKIDGPLRFADWVWGEYVWSQRESTGVHVSI